MIGGPGHGVSDEEDQVSEAQIAFVLKQSEDGASIGEVCPQVGISESTYYNWRKKYAGLIPSEMKRPRQLEEENAELKNRIREIAETGVRYGYRRVHDVDRVVAIIGKKAIGKHGRPIQTERAMADLVGAH